MEHAEYTGQNLVALVLAALCGILDRQNHLPALAPEATLDDLLQALVRAGSDFPKVLQDKIVAAKPVGELIELLTTELLTTELLTWGDIWVVQLMGKIGHPAFIPHLLRVLNETDGLSYIHGDALTAVNGIADDEGDKQLLTAIKNREVGDGISSMSILRHLSYEEAYDLALEKWHDKKDDIDDYEFFAVCLEGIGDPQGVKTLQNIYKHEMSHAGVGDPLESLARLHDMDIPELATIAAQR